MAALPSQQDQQLDVTAIGVVQVVNNRLIVTFTFPPVQQGYVWTGSINVVPTIPQIALEDSFPPGFIFPGDNLDYEMFSVGRYILYRNNIPWLWWHGSTTVTDVRATSTDVVTLTVAVPAFVGQVFAGNGDGFVARWTGQSVLEQDSEFAWPHATGPQTGPVPVFFAGQGIGAPLQVLEYPLPASILVGETDHRLTSPITAGTLTLVPTPSGAVHDYFLWDIVLHASLSALSTVSGAQSWSVNVQGSPSGFVYGAVNLDVVPGTVNSDHIHLSLRGVKTSVLDSIIVSWSASGASTASLSATCVYDNDLGQPG